MTSIDDPAKVERLLVGMKTALPIHCSVTPHLAG
jgi:hypothetical protein